MQKVSPNNLILFKKNELFLTFLVHISVHFFFAVFDKRRILEKLISLPF
jgi:hypothetical protein